MFPNAFIDSNFQIIFSNMPGVPNNAYQDKMKYFDNYVKDITLPGYRLDTENSIYKGHVQKHVLTGKDLALDSFTISFILSEDLLNYFYIFRWIMLHRKGINENNLSSNIVDQKIKKITVMFLSNQKVKVAEYNFENVICTSISNLNLSYSGEEEIVFNVTMEYDSLDFEIFD